jgi:hypothetical protein
MRVVGVSNAYKRPPMVSDLKLAFPDPGGLLFSPSQIDVRITQARQDRTKGKQGKIEPLS